MRAWTDPLCKSDPYAEFHRQPLDLLVSGNRPGPLQFGDPGAAIDISSDAAHDLIRQHLLTLSETKANQLETFAIDQLHVITALSRSPELIGLAAPFAQEVPADAKDGRARQEACRKYLTHYAERYGQPNLLLFNPEGYLVAVVKDELDIGKNLASGPLRDTELARVVDRAKTLLQPDMSDYQIYPGRTQPLAFVASPVFLDGVLEAVVVMELDNNGVFQVLSNYSGLGQTGEILVGTRIGDEAVIVCPLRFMPDAAFKERVPMGDTRGMAIQYAVQGKRGYGELPDYRGVPTAAVWSYLPSFRWGMVIKQDKAEAFALARRQLFTIILVLGVTLVSVVLVALVVARSLSRPIQAALQVTRSVAAGDLTARLQVKATGETGQTAGVDPEDDRLSAGTDRQSPGIERGADVHRDRDRRHLSATESNHE